MPTKSSKVPRARAANHWRAAGAMRFERPDGAVVKYDPDGVLTGSKPWGARHRGWLAYAPGPAVTNVLGYYRRDSRAKVPRRFRCAANAKRAVDSEFPIGRPSDWVFARPPGDVPTLPLSFL